MCGRITVQFSRILSSQTKRLFLFNQIQDQKRVLHICVRYKTIEKVLMFLGDSRQTVVSRNTNSSFSYLLLFKFLGVQVH